MPLLAGYLVLDLTSAYLQHTTRGKEKMISKQSINSYKNEICSLIDTQYGLVTEMDEIDVELITSRRQLGICKMNKSIWYREGLLIPEYIGVNEHLLLDKHYFMGTLVHEFAHAVQGYLYPDTLTSKPRTPHGKEFRSIMKKLGYPGHSSASTRIPIQISRLMRS